MFSFIIGAVVFALGVIFGAAIARTNDDHTSGQHKDNNGP